MRMFLDILYKVLILIVYPCKASFEGLHDITMTDLPPRRKPFLIMAPEDRIGTPHIPIDPEKVVAIVESDYPDQTQANAPEDDTSRSATFFELLCFTPLCASLVRPTLARTIALHSLSLLKYINMHHMIR